MRKQETKIYATITFRIRARPLKVARKGDSQPFYSKSSSRVIGPIDPCLLACVSSFYPVKTHAPQQNNKVNSHPLEEGNT